MDLQRIACSVAVEEMARRHVTAVGGSRWLVEGLVRSGLGGVTLVDFDRFSASNIARQDAFRNELGQLKVAAQAKRLRQINPDLDIEVVPRDFCEIPPDEFDQVFGHTDLFIMAPDAFPPQARANREALRLGKAAMWIGLYPRGRAGEIIYHVPGVTTACYRCIAVDRYRVFRAGGPRISSEGGTIFDLHFVDAVAGQLALGILTRGSSNRHGTLVEQLGNRNLLQLRMDPTYRLGERDIFREHLGSGPANFSFNTIALPMEPEPDCPDCKHLRRATEVSHAADNPA